MMGKHRIGIVYLLVLWLLISALAWPAFVASGTVLSFLHKEGWQLDAWHLLPTRELIHYFISGYEQSLIISIPLGLVAVIDYLLLSRYRITWFVGGILLPLSGAVLAFTLYKQPMVALPTLVLAGLILAIVHRLIDMLAGSASRGRLR